jgi:hypothetical protein
MTQTRIEQVNNIHGAIVNRTIEFVQEARTSTGTSTSIDVDCGGDVTITGVTIGSGSSSDIVNHQRGAAGQFNNAGDQQDARAASDAANEIRRQLENAGIDANLRQKIEATINTEIRQSCVADAGAVVNLRQRSSGDCLIEDVTIDQDVRAAIGNCVQMAAVSIEDATCPATTCQLGTEGKCRGRAPGVSTGGLNFCYDPEDGGACNDGDIDCRQASLDALLLQNVNGADDGDDGELYDPDALSAALDPTFSPSSDDGEAGCPYDNWIIGLGVTLLLVLIILYCSMADSSGQSATAVRVVVVTHA